MLQVFTMRSHKKASAAQLSYLANYMKNHIEMASAHHSHSLQRKAELESQWTALSVKLNSLGGPIKTVSKWKQAWRDMRNNLRKKVSQNQNENGYGSGGTCSRLPSLIPMSAADEDVLAAIGPEAVYGTNDDSTTEVLTENADSSQLLRHRTSPLHVQPAPPDGPRAVQFVQSRKRKRSAPNLEPNISGALDGPPQWAIDIEERRVVATERIADSLEMLTSAVMGMHKSLATLSNDVLAIKNSIVPRPP